MSRTALASAIAAALIVHLVPACDEGAVDPATPCLPDCAAPTCGEDDGCGGTCGQCPCVPECAGRQCDDDGCGGTCGTCPADATCGPDGACTAVSPCPADLSCVEEAHVAYVYACVREASGLPWAWGCTRGAAIGWLGTAAECDMTCTGGESACHEADSHGAECRACVASCADGVEYACAAEAAGSCPAPCACR